LETVSVQIHTTKEGGGAVVQLQGKVDATSAPSVEQALLGVIDQGEKKLVIDCANLDFISSAGLRSLLLAVKKMKAAGGVIALAALQPHVKEVFDISGFSALFLIHGSKAEALK
jgi:stage II sporulation protein AA (anti-sigma F factor antagonist)